MVVTLTGENGFALLLEQRRLVEAFVSQNGDLALERLDGEETDFTRLQEALTSLPFLSNKKLVLLRSPGKNKQFTERFEQILADIPETTDVILIEPKLDKRLSYYKLLKSKTDFREFRQLDSADLARWLVDEAKAGEGSLSSSDARYLIERVGPNQQLLANELEKLLLYDPKITRRTIETLTEEAPQSTIFQLLEAAFAGNIKQTLALYTEQRALKVEPPQIIAMLAWQLHVLAVVKTAGDRPPEQIASEARLNPFVVRKSQSVARHLTLADLKKLVADLLTIDVKIKTTSINSDEALQNYLLGLAA